MAEQYLIATDSEYYADLAADSKKSLLFQGGFMTAEEVEAFELDATRPGKASLEYRLEMRRIDDEAKQVGLSVPGIEYYLPHLRTCIETFAVDTD